MSTDMRGTAIERNHHRYQKLNGIVTWYFDSVMGSLPLTLQVALLLPGCALSRYLWEIVTVTLAILSVTSLGILFYLFIVIVGSASASCKYQTPGPHIIQAIAPTFRHALRSCAIAVSFDLTLYCWLRGKIKNFPRDILDELPLHLHLIVLKGLQAMI